MKKIKLVSALASLAVASLIGIPAAVAQDDDSDNIARLYYLEIVPGHRAQFEAGWKAYGNCLDENGGGNYSFNALEPESGKLAGIIFRTGGHNWADFDAPDTAAVACDDIFQGSFLPHIKEAYSRFTQRISFASQPIDGETNVLTFIDFDVKDVGDAVEMIGKFSETAEANDEKGIFWSRNITSFNDWNIRVAILRSNFADMSPDVEGFWDRQAAHHGEEAAAALRERWQENVNKINNSIWSRTRNLDYSPNSE